MSCTLRINAVLKNKKENVQNEYLQKSMYPVFYLQCSCLRRDSAPTHNLKAITTVTTQHMIHGAVNYPTRFQNVTPEREN